MSRQRARRHRRTSIAAIALTLAVASAAAGQPATVRAIWVSPFSSAAVVPVAMRTIGSAGLDTVVVPVFYDGRVIYPSRVFPQHGRYAGSDPAAAVIAEAHRRGMRAFAALDVLYWQSSDDPSPAIANHPQWLERTAESRVIGDVAGRAGGFVSPSEPRVASLLADLAAELAARYDFDGVVLDYARWSRLDFLGYADADRKLYLQERRTDPLDVDLLGFDTPDDMIQALVSWQEQQITAVTAAVAQAFRRGQPAATVLAVVEPRYYVGRATDPVRQDWRSWLGQGWLTGVVPAGLTYSDPAALRSDLQANGLDRARAVALIRPSRTASLLRQMQVASSARLEGFILWGRDSLEQRRQVLRELEAP